MIAGTTSFPSGPIRNATQWALLSMVIVISPVSLFMDQVPSTSGSPADLRVKCSSFGLGWGVCDPPPPQVLQTRSRATAKTIRREAFIDEAPQFSSVRECSTRNVPSEFSHRALTTYGRLGGNQKDIVASDKPLPMSTIFPFAMVAVALTTPSMNI